MDGENSDISADGKGAEMKVSEQCAEEKDAEKATLVEEKAATQSTPTGEG